MKKEIEVTLPNGYTVGIFEYENRMVIELINSNGFTVSDTNLTETEVKTLQTIFPNKDLVEKLDKLTYENEIRKEVMHDNGLVLRKDYEELGE
jgi:hypothetical protein